jgi:hypothetical protein
VAAGATTRDSEEAADGTGEELGSGGAGRAREGAGRQFHQLLLKNPHYFGNFPESGLKPILELAGNIFYEQLTCVAYNFSRDELEATVQMRALRCSRGARPGLARHGCRRRGDRPPR